MYMEYNFVQINRIGETSEQILNNIAKTFIFTYKFNFIPLFHNEIG